MEVREKYNSKDPKVVVGGGFLKSYLGDLRDYSCT